MNKKGVSMVVIALIIAIVGAAVYFGLLYKIKQEAFDCNLNKQVINEWVVQTGVQKELTRGITTTNYPPVENLCDPFEINSLEDFKPQKNKPPIIHKAIADTMVDCWNAFGSGDIEFLGMVNKEKAFCFPCRAFIFSEKIKKSKIEIIGLNQFLRTNKPYAGKSIPTYAELLTHPA